MRGILFDLDGVIYLGEDPFPGAVDVLRWVRDQGIPHLFLTNTTSRSRQDLVDKLRGMGIETDVEHIWCPPAAAAQWLRSAPPGPVALFAQAPVHSEFDGLTLLPPDAEGGARYVVIGDLEADWTFATLNRAFRLLMENDASRLIALGMTRYWETAGGLQLDVGPFVAALLEATGRKPVVLGKPAAAFFQTAVDSLGLPASDVVMVGDDIRTDVDAAQRARLHGILVRTGKFRDADLEQGIAPTAVLDDVSALPDWWAANA